MVTVRRCLSLLLVSLVLGACSAPEPGGPTATPQAANSPTETDDSRTRAANSPTRAANTTTRAANTPVVVLDPGHNGGNASHPAAINRQVPAGRGRSKACNTTGTATEDGYPEHAFNLDVARRVGEQLGERGIEVAYTRTEDDGVGPCVHERARIGNEHDADAVVSIHADGATDPGAHGFHLAYSAPPLNEAQGEPTLRLVEALREGMRDAGFPVADYLGEHGLSGRDDLAGMNLSTRPSALVECGNMRNPEEAAAMSSAEGRRRYAAAIAAGILAYLGR
ncbi:N-acetylmuramoyl-L-alanine amidase [Amycolatopsis cihanbeyliensis]|uniref:N-acetylmuramoyl-L-alanine amidase n=1 Tax=Amycolatopsis cihanbeyliensis TaxID=1128664 RepID=A0A542DMQ9_AMYCI|nr:N-acetylmuramoyl-L-alanine amidase [Amycolatopsis cihanbeyliensis]